MTVSHKAQPLLATLTWPDLSASRFPIQSNNGALMPQCMLLSAPFCPAQPRPFFRNPSRSSVTFSWPLLATLAGQRLCELPVTMLDDLLSISCDQCVRVGVRWWWGNQCGRRWRFPITSKMFHWVGFEPWVCGPKKYCVSLLSVPARAVQWQAFVMGTTTPPQPYEVLLMV
jgi:hypothetical protein